MNLYHLKSVAASVAFAGVGGVLIGLVFAVVADHPVLYGVATGQLVAGLVVLGGGLLGAAEPPDGWMTGRGPARGQYGRRSVVARIASEHPDVEEISSWELAAWGLVVGGLLIGLALFLFELAR